MRLNSPQLHAQMEKILPTASRIFLAASAVSVGPLGLPRRSHSRVALGLLLRGDLLLVLHRTQLARLALWTPIRLVRA